MSAPRRPGDKSESFACSNGHFISTVDGHRPARCPIYVLGKPCEGMLTVVGRRVPAGTQDPTGKRAVAR